MKKSVAEFLEKNKKAILNNLFIGKASWDLLLLKTKTAEDSSCDLKDEQLLTFILSCAYAISKSGSQQFAKNLLSDLNPEDRKEIALEDADKIWFEVLPFPGRKKERNTNLDLAFGNISRRKNSGIELKHGESTWINFLECKLFSDISKDVKNDTERNQLARVIENALYFRSEHSPCFAKTVVVTLVTLKKFKECLENESRGKSRLFQYKFEEYKNSKEKILIDLKSCSLELRENLSEITLERLGDLKLLWATYEDLIEKAPDSLIKDWLTQKML